MDEAGDVSAEATDDGSTPEPELSAVPEPPSDDAQADAPVNDEDSDPAVKWSRSRGFQAFDDKARRALGEDHYRVLNDNARLAKERETIAQEREQLRAEIEKLRATPAAPKAPPEPPADLKKLTSHITSLKADVEAIPNRENTLYKEFDQHRLDLERCKVRLEVADDLDKPTWQAKISAAEKEIRAVTAEINRLPREKRLLEIELDRAERERLGLESTYEEQERERQEAGEKATTFKREFPVKVDNWISHHAADLKIPGLGNPEFEAVMQEGVIALLMKQYQMASGVTLTDSEHEALVRTTIEKWAKSHDLISRVKLQQVSKQKKPAARQAPPPPTNRSWNPFDNPPPSEEQIAAERAARIARAANS